MLKKFYAIGRDEKFNKCWQCGDIVNMKHIEYKNIPATVKDVKLRIKYKFFIKEGQYAFFDNKVIHISSKQELKNKIYNSKLEKLL